MAQFCISCRYFHAATGSCKHGPPTIIAVKGQVTKTVLRPNAAAQMQLLPLAVFPVIPTPENFWCHSWEGKENSDG